MDVEITHRPGSAAAHITLGPRQTCTAEGGAMISMSGDMGIETTTHQRGQGGFGKALKRMLTGESFFLNHFTAGEAGGEVVVAATLPGDMTTLELDGNELIVQAGSFVASDEAVNLDLGWQGFKSLLSGENMFWLKATGHGKLVVNSFGVIYPIDVRGEEIVDTGHIVAFDSTLDFRISKAGASWIASILGGEGLVCRFHGEGRVWCQSHNATGFGRLLGPKLRPRR